MTCLLTVFLGLQAAAVFAQASQGDPLGEAPFTVVLDAGHGGHDPGNLGNGFLEKNIALNIVLQAGKALEQTKNVKVVYTRDNDTFVDLYKRGEIANKAKADLFVSVHCDSHSSDAHGAGTFVLGLHANKQNFEVAKKENSVIYLEDNYETRYAAYNINSPESVIGLTIMQEEFLEQSILLGKLMQDRFTGSLRRKDRKVKQAGFIVLHQTFMPSVLIETGFLTNRDEGRYLNSRKGQQEIGGAIAAAILEYRSTIRSNSTSLVASIPGNTPDDTQEAATPVEKEPGATADREKGLKDTEVQAEKKEAIGNAGDQREEEAAVKSASQGEPKYREESGIVFKVQLMAVTKEIPLTPANFKGLNTLSSEPYKNMYRILYGNTFSYDQAKLLQAGARQKGYSQAYIVAYRDGERIPVEKALQYLSN
ncbi:MAG: N-acetylmuramoyl-L-alanine amidase [Flavobacteriaceae bacterium]|nr:MAG: N-acetylmuramoyl-L-alanine amidase [Flavobacteriaceae bacterium]